VNPRIDLCCNDPDNGNETGFVSAVHVGDLELISNRWWLPSRPGPRLRVDGDRFILAGKAWPFVGYKGWVEPEVCADFLIWLHGRRLMSIEQAETRIFNLWKRPDPLAGSRDFLVRYFSKPSVIGADG